MPLLADEAGVNASFIRLETALCDESAVHKTYSQGPVASLGIPDTILLNLAIADTTVALVAL